MQILNDKKCNNNLFFRSAQGVYFGACALLLVLEALTLMHLGTFFDRIRTKGSAERTIIRTNTNIKVRTGIKIRRPRCDAVAW